MLFSMGFRPGSRRLDILSTTPVSEDGVTLFLFMYKSRQAWQEPETRVATSELSHPFTVTFRKGGGRGLMISIPEMGI